MAMADHSDGRSEWWSTLTRADKEFLHLWLETEVRRILFDLVPRLIDARLAARLDGIADELLDLGGPLPSPPRLAHARWPRRPRQRPIPIPQKPPIPKHNGGKRVYGKSGTRAGSGSGRARR